MPRSLPMVGVLGISCTVLSLFVRWPQAWKVRGGRPVDGVSVVGTALSCTAQVSWLTYGVIQHNYVVIITNVAVAMANVMILNALSRAGLVRLPRLVLPFTLAAVTIAGLGQIAPPLVGVLGGAIGMITSVPLLISAMTAPNINGVSLLTYVLSLLGAVSWFLYGFACQDMVVMLPNVVGIPTNLLMIGAIVVRRPGEQCEPTYAESSLA